ALRQRLEELCRQELDSFCHEFGPFSQEQDKTLHTVTSRITQRIAGSLARELKEMPEKVEQEQMTAAVQRLFHLGFGLILGYLFRGSAPVPSTATAATTSEPAAPAGMPGVPASMTAPGTGELNSQQTWEMVQKAAQPLLENLKQNPRDFDTLVKVGNLYYDSKLYPESIKYYEHALKLRPENSDVRTDMGTAYWYTGNPDQAIAEFNRALKYNATHPGTLFNMGVV